MLNARSNLEVNERVVHEVKEAKVRLTNAQDFTSIKTTVSVTLTNRRLVIAGGPVTYTVAGKGDREFRDLTLPLVPSASSGGIQNARVVSPWFGPHRWVATVVPARQSNLEPACMWDLTLVFTEGGAVEFSRHFAELVSDAFAVRGTGVDEPLPPYSEQGSEEK